ncbi:MAG: EF-hand domain-containing protein [Lentisphaeria bacterium]
MKISKFSLAIIVAVGACTWVLAEDGEKTVKAKHEQMRLEHFNKIDGNQDGKITFEEMKAFHASRVDEKRAKCDSCDSELGEKPKRREMDRRGNRAVRNSDEASLEEPSEPGKKMFEMMDKDGDGAVILSEFFMPRPPKFKEGFRKEKSAE